MLWFFSNILTTPMKTSTKVTKKHTEKKGTTLHNTINDQIFSDNLIPRPPAPSPTAQNTKQRHGKDTELLKPGKKKSKKKQLLELATSSALVGKKAKLEPRQFCQRRISHLRILLHAYQHHSP
jgi:hypothetical protein